MNLDDPKLTAFALGELLPNERAEIEALLRTDPGASAEVAETLEIARILRGGLQAEEGAPLADHQRDAILRAASLAGLEHRPLDPAERPAPAVVLTHPAWWNRPGPWQAIAACAVLGFGIYALSFPPPTTPTNNRLAGGDNRISMPIPPGEEQKGSLLVNSANAEGPKETPNSPAAPKISTNLANASNNGATLPSVTPPIPAVTPKNGIHLANTPENPPAIAIGPDEVNRTTPQPATPKGPNVLGSNPQFAATDKTGQAEQFLTDRLAEAARIHAGSTGEEFLKVFRNVPGVPGQYSMVHCSAIRVDAKFEDNEGHLLPLNELPVENSKLKEISPPYLKAAK